MRHLLFSFLATISVSIQAQIDSIQDPLLLSEVVISDFANREVREHLGSASILQRPADYSIAGASDVMRQINGFFADASTGEVFGRVYTRGVSLSAEDDIGWYYMSLQEDGLPISAVQFQQFSPDFFLRPDVSHEKTEVIKGGKSAIIAPNSPGGVINFVSKRPTQNYQSQDRLTLGLYDGGRPQGRIEGYSGGPISSSNWGYDFSYLYRYDDGARQVNQSMNNGGQLKLGLYNTIPSGIVDLKIKFLDDKVNRYTGVPATDWDNPQPLEGFSFQQSTLLSPGWDDRDHNLGGLYTYNPQNGIKTQELSAQLNVDLAVGAWRLTNRLKYSDKDVDWQTVIGGQPLGLENFLTYFISGDPFPSGLVTFTDVVSNQQLAIVDNNEAFGVFQGLPPGFSYTQGTLPNDAIMASGAWKKDDSIDEWMNELRLSADWNDVQLTVGSFAALSDVDVFTNASFLYSTYEDESRPLRVQLENPGEPIRDLSDRFGVSNYGGLFYEAASIEVGQIAVFTDATLKLTTPLTANVGLRYERINHSGSKDRSAQDPIEGGLDVNPLTSYDAAPLIAGDTDPIDFSYDYLSYSAGLSYDLGQNHSLFARHSVGNKAPELNYYMDNFANQPVDGPAPIQSVTQSELGFVSNQRDYGIQIIGFYSQLDDVPYTNFAFDESTNQIFYSPTQLNSASSIGIEVNTSVRLTKSLSLNASGTFQNANLDEFTLYDANESIATEDDEIRSFDDNTPTHNPGILGRIGLVYEEADWYVDLHWNHTGQRQGNLSNAFQLPSYSTVDMNVGYALSDRWSIGVRGRNILNTAGLQNFFGPNQFGSNSDAASEAFINENPNGSFVVFPIMPRTIFLTIEFAFSK